MSFTPAEYEPSKLTIGEPTKADGAYDYATMNIGYASRKPSLYMPTWHEASPIKENPKKPGSLTQGIRINDPALLKMGADIETRVLAKIVECRKHKDMPKGIDRYETVEQLKGYFPSIKLFIHHPKKKDDKGNSTSEIDLEADKMIYPTLIRSSLANGGEVFTKYYSAAILNPKIEAAIKSGQEKESKFLYPVVTDKHGNKGLFERKCGMVMIPTITINDVYISSDKIKIRFSISDAYVKEFKSNEPANRKNIKAAIGDVEMTGPTEMPDAPLDGKGDDSDSDEPQKVGGSGGGSNSKTQVNKVEPPVASSGFKVTVLE